MSKPHERNVAECTTEKYLSLLFSKGVWSKGVVLRKLRERGVSKDEAEVLVQRYAEAGFFDDAAYALLFVDSHPDWGVRRLRDELRKRGVSEKDMREALDNVDEDERAVMLLRNWIEQGVERRKAEARLLRRGFSSKVFGNAFERACRGELGPVK